MQLAGCNRARNARLAAVQISHFTATPGIVHTRARAYIAHRICNEVPVYTRFVCELVARGLCEMHRSCDQQTWSQTTYRWYLISATLIFSATCCRTRWLSGVVPNAKQCTRAINNSYQRYRMRNQGGLGKSTSHTFQTEYFRSAGGQYSCTSPTQSCAMVQDASLSETGGHSIASLVPR